VNENVGQTGERPTEAPGRHGNPDSVPHASHAPDNISGLSVNSRIPVGAKADPCGPHDFAAALARMAGDLRKRTEQLFHTRLYAFKQVHGAVGSLPENEETLIVHMLLMCAETIWRQKSKEEWNRWHDDWSDPT